MLMRILVCLAVTTSLALATVALADRPSRDQTDPRAHAGGTYLEKKTDGKMKKVPSKKPQAGTYGKKPQAKPYGQKDAKIIDEN